MRPFWHNGGITLSEKKVASGTFIIKPTGNRLGKQPMIWGRIAGAVGKAWNSPVAKGFAEGTGVGAGMEAVEELLDEDTEDDQEPEEDSVKDETQPPEETPDEAIEDNTLDTDYPIDI